MDRVLGTVLGLHLWCCGLSYPLGFLNARLYIGRHRRELELPRAATFDLSPLLAGGVLLGGRFLEVAFYEWPFYREHPALIPALWLGGMATHGLLLGGLLGTWYFCRLYARSFLQVTDMLAIPVAFILGAGRLGNFGEAKSSTASRRSSRHPAPDPG
ncbi:prolipoprotein diacylglyceryl transferase [Candidatus Poribacteria bacterium]|nr:prolipoprotein diacylglyceryl transferase [Candidatus Poribacteria bacterium]